MTGRNHLLVARAIADGHVTRAAICRATGFDPTTATNAIITLRRTTLSRGPAITSTGRPGYAIEAKYTLTTAGRALLREEAQAADVVVEPAVPLLERVWPARIWREARA